MLSRFNQRPGLTHWKELLHVCKYLLGTVNLSLTLNPTDNDDGLTIFSDATWADDPETRLLQSGYIINWLSCPVAWKSRKQSNITLSKTEAELNALIDSAQEGLWINSVVWELLRKAPTPTTFLIDNKGLLDKIRHFGSNSKTKHIDMKLKWFWELYNDRLVVVQLISSNEMVADAFSKGSSRKMLDLLLAHCFE